MKSTDFLKEDEIDKWAHEKPQSKLGSELDAYIQLIRKHCQPYLQQVTNPTAMYRGFGAYNELFAHNEVDLNKRPPINTPPEVHKALNIYFKKQFGAEFRNALFCTGNSQDASYYGRLFVVFPIGEFDFLWSPNIKDLFVEYKRLAYKGETDLKEFIGLLKRKGNYQTTDLNAAIISGKEIMIRCHSYYGLNFEDIKDNLNLIRHELHR